MRSWLLRHVTARRAAVATCVLALLAAPWIALVPMGVWRGIAVLEPCDRKAEARFGETTSAVRGAEHLRWFPPAWDCPLANGESVSVSLFG